MIGGGLSGLLNLQVAKRRRKTVKEAHDMAMVCSMREVCHQFSVDHDYIVR